MLLYSIITGRGNCSSPWQRRMWKGGECMCTVWFFLRSSPAMLTVMQRLQAKTRLMLWRLQRKHRKCT